MCIVIVSFYLIIYPDQVSEICLTTRNNWKTKTWSLLSTKKCYSSFERIYTDNNKFRTHYNWSWISLRTCFVGNRTIGSHNMVCVNKHGHCLNKGVTMVSLTSEIAMLFACFFLQMILAKLMPVFVIFVFSWLWKERQQVFSYNIQCSLNVYVQSGLFSSLFNWSWIIVHYGRGNYSFWDLKNNPVLFFLWEYCIGRTNRFKFYTYLLSDPISFQLDFQCYLS